MTESVGAYIELDGRFAGNVRFKGEMGGRKGVWLGLEMEETVGDGDGMFGDKQYFQCEDAHGIFVREGAGRVVAKAAKELNMPAEMLDHMKFLFNEFDEEKTGNLTLDNLQHAMTALQGKTSHKDVKAIFTKFDEEDGNGMIDFHEFCLIMQDQLKGVDLGKVVAIVKEHEAEEERQAELERQKKEGSAMAEVDLVVRIGRPAPEQGFDVNLKYAGKNLNAGLLFVYGLLALTATWQLMLEIPEDMFNKLLVVSLGGMAALFAVGGFAMHTYNWPTIKLYAVLMFFGAGGQLAMGILHYSGMFGVTSGTVVSVMDRKCGTCLGDDKSACGGGSVFNGLTGGDIDFTDMPWYCCCAHNSCFDFDSVMSSPPSCQDGCMRADLSGDQPSSLAACRAISAWLVGDNPGYLADPTQACVHLVASDAMCVPESLTAGAGQVATCGALTANRRECILTTSCRYNDAAPETCLMPVDLTDAPIDNCYEHRSSNATCREQGSCLYSAAIYGGQSNLDANEEIAKATCKDNEDYQDNLVNAISGSSKYGDDRCFTETKDTDAVGSLAQCVAEFQSSAQTGYITFIFVMFPIQLLAAYIGWILPEIYFKHKENENGYDSEKDVIKFTNPFDADEDTPERGDAPRKVAEAQETARNANSIKQAGVQLTADEQQVLSGRSQQDAIVSKQASRALFLKRDLEGNTLDVRLLAEGADDKLGLVIDKNSKAPPRIGKVTANGLAHEAKLKVGWRILSVQGVDISLADYSECVKAIKAVDYHLDGGLKMVVMLDAGEELEGEGGSSETDDEEATAEAEQIAANKAVQAEEKLSAADAAKARAAGEKKRAAANKKKKIDKEKKEAAEEKARKKAIHDKKIADEKAANDAKKHKKEEEKAAKAFAKAAAAGGSAEDVGTRFVNPLDETFGNVDSGRSPSVDAAPRVEHAPDDLTIDVYHGGGKKYRAVLPGIIRATVDFHSAKLGNLHPPEEIVSLEEDGNRVRFDAHNDRDFPSGWVSKASAKGVVLLEPVDQVPEEYK